MKMHFSTFALALLVIMSAALLTGCSRTVHVVRGDSLGEPSRYEKFTQGEERSDSIKLIRVGSAAPKVRSTITVTEPLIRLFISAKDSVISNHTNKKSYPAFLVHAHLNHPPQDLMVTFQSSPEFVYKPDEARPMSAWFYFYGHAPIGRTRRVRAVGSGTEFLIQVTDNADIVYMLGSASDYVDVYSTNSADPCVICRTLRIGQMTIVTDDGACSEAQSYIGTTYEEFVDEALEEILETP